MIGHSREYERHLKSPEWRERKRRYIKRHGYYCRGCGSRKNLQLHHSAYESLGHEPDSDLWLVCLRCHRLCHRFYTGGRYATLRQATWAALESMKEHRRRATKRRERAKRICRRLRH